MMFRWSAVEEAIAAVIPDVARHYVAAVGAALSAGLAYLATPLVEAARWMSTLLVMLQQVRPPLSCALRLGA